MVGRKKRGHQKETENINIDLESLKNILLPEIIKHIEAHIKRILESNAGTSTSSIRIENPSTSSSFENNNGHISPSSSADSGNNSNDDNQSEHIMNIETRVVQPVSYNTDSNAMNVEPHIIHSTSHNNVNDHNVESQVFHPVSQNKEGNLLWNEKFMTPPKFAGHKDDDVYEYIFEMKEFFTKLGIQMETTKRKYISQSIDREVPAGQLLFIEDCNNMTSDEIFELLKNTFGMPSETNKQAKMKELANLKPTYNDTPMSYLVKIMYLLRKINNKKSKETLYSDAKPYLIKELSASKADKLIAASSYIDGLQVLKRAEFAESSNSINFIKQKNYNSNSPQSNQYTRNRVFHKQYNTRQYHQSHCYKCGSKAHMTKQCTLRKCYVCKRDGHDEKHCWFNENKKYCHFHKTKMHDNTECRAQVKNTLTNHYNKNFSANHIDNDDSSQNMFNSPDDEPKDNHFTSWLAEDYAEANQEN